MRFRRLITVKAAPLALSLFALGVGIFVVGVGAQTLKQYDLPWHLAFGRQIFDTGTIPSVDSFSFAGSQIRYLGVVSDLLLYGLMKLGGPLALQLFGAAMALALAMILSARALEHGLAGLGLAALGLFAMHRWLTVRPATMTFVFCATLLALLEIHRRNPHARRGRLAMAVALFVMPLWANCHAGGTIGVLILLLYAGHRTLATYLTTRAPNLLPASDGGAIGLPWIVAVVAPLLMLVNPAGISYFTGVADVSPFVEQIAEWRPTSVDYFLHVVPTAGAFLVLSVCFFVIGREPSESRVPPLYEIGLVAGSAMLFTIKRFVPLAIVVLVPVVARRMGRICGANDRSRILLASTVVAAGISVVSVGTRTFGIGWEPTYFPRAAVGFVEREHPQGRMWNFWPYGGYLIWRLYPEYQVSLDGRFGLVTYEPDYVRLATASANKPRAFEQMVDEYHLEWAFCFARTDWGKSGKAVAKDSRWTMVYWDDLAAIYVRTDGPNRDLAARGYRLFRHLTAPAHVVDLALRKTRPEDISHDGALARKQAPTSTRALFLDAVGALAVDDRDRFLNALQALGDLAPYHPALRVLAGLVPRFRSLQ